MQSLDVNIDECIYLLSPDAKPFTFERLDEWDHIGTQTSKEWKAVTDTGICQEFTSNGFPWPYAYAKHLTERLLVSLFMQHESIRKLLISRPSVFFPSIKHPYPNYGNPNSTPSAFLAANMLLYSRNRLNLAARSSNPDTEATIDEAPIDLVVDRLLLHIAYGTYGCVHVDAGSRSRSRFCDWWLGRMKECRVPWKVRHAWTSLDWHSRKLHPIARLFVILGTSFNFKAKKRDEFFILLSDEQKTNLKLYLGDHKPYDFETRRQQTCQMALMIVRRKVYPVLFGEGPMPILPFRLT